MITFTLTFEHDPASDSPAFELRLTDVVPLGMSYVRGSLRWTGVGTATNALDDSGAPTLTAVWDVFSLGAVSEIEFQPRMGNLRPGRRVTNTTLLGWTSLPDDGIMAPRSLSAYDAYARERFYDPGTAIAV